ncbi:serine/threonine-protein kinase [Marilutibacter alkalisoli]|uniref:Protein kinase n=1 Tax=Marilutibacter alkalisoli TaxID=2591633 RepID=A0A514BUP7_9GAMM|nr:serine/threonine-protein kinase [Lysobacter alkalisoli]QDH71092.1 protein kinase [Lysobacter alkalisoli]
MKHQASWERIEQLFAAASRLPPAARAAYVNAVCSDEQVHAEVMSLLQADASAEGYLDSSPAPASGMTDAGFTLSSGDRLGPWLVCAPLDHGGMGEVYLGERADGAFHQTVALKLLRHEAVAQVERFHAEREILARLEHPGIARLLDGGISTDGRPWAALEYVEGEPIDRYCRQHALPAENRLHLLLQVCDAVDHAHRNLVVHRDIKPSNILVDAAGRARLLDFGIAKPIVDAAAPTLTQAVLTPDWCAPEQLAGEPVTTATDIHALGLLLFHLLTDTRPWPLQGQPLVRTVRLMLDTPAPPMRAVAAAGTALAHAPHRLRSDLEAIVARCLRREPERRYVTVDALHQDIQRALDGAPVAAREGARLYVLGRLLRRYRWPVAATATLLMTLTAGLVGTAWQARRAEQQAAQATAIRNYLVQLFKASDPRIASDRPRGQITARELLDIGSARLDSEFADRPELQLEMLGLTAEIYRALGERERYAALQASQVALARQLHGDHHPAVIHALLLEADDARQHDDHATALALVERADPLIRRAGLDHSALRARWWLHRANALEADLSQWPARVQALEEATRLFERTAPDDWDRVITLANLATAYWERGQHGDAAHSRDWLRRALTVAESARERDDGELQVMYANLGHLEAFLGSAADAEAAFATAASLTQQTHGEHNRRYWHAAAGWAGLLHEIGERERALAIFEALQPLLPAEPAADERGTVALARAAHGIALLREGRPQVALPLLEAAERDYRLSAAHRYQIHYAQQGLGEALAALGRHPEARHWLQQSLQGREADNPADSVPVLDIRSRWGGFLLARGEIGEARRQLTRVLADAGPRRLPSVALAQAGLARLALEEGDTAAALRHSGDALATHDRSEGLRDARLAPELWWLHARALAQAGNAAQARGWAERAVDGYRRHHHPDSAERAAAEAWLARLERAP